MTQQSWFDELTKAVVSRDADPSSRRNFLGVAFTVLGGLLLGSPASAAAKKTRSPVEPKIPSGAKYCDFPKSRKVKNGYDACLNAAETAGFASCMNLQIECVIRWQGAINGCKHHYKLCQSYPELDSCKGVSLSREYARCAKEARASTISCYQSLVPQNQAYKKVLVDGCKEGTPTPTTVDPKGANDRFCTVAKAMKTRLEAQQDLSDWDALLEKYRMLPPVAHTPALIEATNGLVSEYEKAIAGLKKLPPTMHPLERISAITDLVGDATNHFLEISGYTSAYCGFSLFIDLPVVEG